ncbi:MAG: hypothetical protein PUF39_03965 [Prevotellaceae bacterium]|nr:hypothetical protein [Prevotellaceae bacterium]
MLVIHPKDKTTAMLSALYEGLEAQVVDDCRSTKEMGHMLHHVSTQERIMLLGHGSDKGLFYHADDSKEGFDKIIVGHPHAFHLRKHGGNMVAVWCNAEGDNQGTATDVGLLLPLFYHKCNEANMGRLLVYKPTGRSV